MNKDLLAPRYEVIADWPFNDRFKVGNILNFFRAVADNTVEEFYYHHDKTHQNFQDVWFDQYPHLFRRLQWWEKRKPEEMPEYVKSSMYPKEYVIKIEGHFTGIMHNEQGLYPFINDAERFVFKGKYHNQDSYYRDFLPATESEYQSYLKSK